MNTHQLELNPQPLIQTFETIIGNLKQLAVNARDLHLFLEVGKRFASWIQERIGKYEFVENEDFIIFPKSGKNLKERFPDSENDKKGGRPTVDYYITLDMAKELSMVENNAKGREARRYFIAMEKKALGIVPQSAPVPPVEKREYLTTSDMNNFKRLIYSCRHQLDHKDAWNQGIWYALRDVTGVPSPARFEVQHLPVLAQEFQRILSIILPFIKAKHECEQALIKQVLRGRGDHAVIQVLLNNMHQSTNASLNEFNQVLQKHLPMTFNQECLNLLNRRPNHYDHSDCNERLI